MAAIKIITRTERPGRWSHQEREAILADANRPGTTVKAVARRHGVAESLLYGWRAARRKAAAAAAEPMQLIAYGALGGLRTLPPAMSMVSPAPLRLGHSGGSVSRSRPSRGTMTLRSMS